MTEEAGGSALDADDADTDAVPAGSRAQVPAGPQAAEPQAARPQAAGPQGLARWRRTITAAFGLGGITIAAWGPRLPAIKTSLGIGTATIGLLLAGVTVGAIGGLLASTPVLHWLGSRRAVTSALLLIAAALAVMGAGLAAGLVPVLAVAFVVTGFGIGLLDVLINVEGAAVERAARRTLMPMMHAAWSVGVAAGAGIGAACAALGIAPAAQMIAEAVLIAAAALALAAGIPAGNRAADGQPPPDGGAKGSRFRHWLHGWLDWRLLLIGVVMLGVELGEGSAGNWLTLAVRNGHGQAAAVAALFATAFAAGEATTRIFGGPLVDRLGRVLTIRVTTALGVVGMLLFILAGNIWVVLVGVLLWSVGVSMGFPLGMSAAAESGPDPAARVSVVASIGYFANLAGPPAIGVLAQSVGLLNSMWLIVAMFVAAFAAAGSFRPRPAGPTPEEP
ncbi:MAG TPA: MFS transporter [Streptosporangiaceae bacterium]|nr:MFS transporter [Streptosporangiaceae bacterium]